VTTANPTRRSGAWTQIAAGIGASALVLTGCASTGSTTAGTDGESFSYLSFTENTQIAETLTTLSTGACAAENADLPLEVTNQPQAAYDQQLQLLAGQDALPSIFAVGNTPQVAKDLNKSGQILDLNKALTDLGAADAILPAAATAVEGIYGAPIGLPVELNIEGIWYNKTILEANGITTAPATWDELLADAAIIDAAGITPFAAAGKDGWPITRLVGNYIQRELGTDALAKVADGSAKLTDAEYVKAAAAIAELGAKNYFGAGVGSVDYGTAANAFLAGNAAFFYMGSWAVGDFNDATKNTIGADNVGFVGFPTVAGGTGTADQLGANVGVPLAMSSKTYGPKTAAWLGCIAENYGVTALTAGTVTGLKVNGTVEVSTLTQGVQDSIAATQTSVLWFEALFSAKASTTSQTNAALLVTGEMTPEEYMAAIQADLD
jgi:raffinose/stachyose/melibiose transport system substrate-binding protein